MTCSFTNSCAKFSTTRKTPVRASGAYSPRPKTEISYITCILFITSQTYADRPPEPIFDAQPSALSASPVQLDPICKLFHQLLYFDHLLRCHLLSPRSLFNQRVVIILAPLGNIARGGGCLQRQLRHCKFANRVPHSAICLLSSVFSAVPPEVSNACKSLPILPGWGPGGQGT